MNTTTPANITMFEELNSFAQLLKENGFTVIYHVPNEGRELPTWLHFFKNGYMGCVQMHKYRGASFGHEYKPSREHGTGCTCLEEGAELTIENAEKATGNIPTWIYEGQRNPEPVKLWQSAEEFISKETILKHAIL
jgi:hypothetical protein